MAITFPSPVADGYSFTAENGVVYTFDSSGGGGWYAYHPDGLNDVYVNISGDTMTGDLTVPSLNGGPLGGMRNQIINGDFRIWQRGTSFTSGGYTADRWIGSGAGGSTRTISQYDTVEFKGIQCSFSSGGNASSRTSIQQKIEGVETFAGQTVTLSFEVFSANVTQISTDIQQFFGNNGSPSATVDFAPKKHTGINNSWQKFSYSFAVPSVAGKTIGTAGNDCLQVNFFLEAGSDYDARTDSLGTQSGAVIIRNVQLEPGSVATPFEHRPIGTELALCQRYYYQVSNTIMFYRYSTTEDDKRRASFIPSTPMRVAPTLATLGGGTNTGGGVLYGGTENFFDFRVTGANTGLESYVNGFTADAEL